MCLGFVYFCRRFFYLSWLKINVAVARTQKILIVSKHNDTFMLSSSFFLVVEVFQVWRSVFFCIVGGWAWLLGRLLEKQTTRVATDWVHIIKRNRFSDARDFVHCYALLCWVVCLSSGTFMCSAESVWWISMAFVGSSDVVSHEVSYSQGREGSEVESPAKACNCLWLTDKSIYDSAQRAVAWNLGTFDFSVQYYIWHVWQTIVFLYPSSWPCIQYHWCRWSCKIWPVCCWLVAWKYRTEDTE